MYGGTIGVDIERYATTDYYGLARAVTTIDTVVGVALVQERQITENPGWCEAWELVVVEGAPRHEA